MKKIFGILIGCFIVGFFMVGFTNGASCDQQEAALRACQLTGSQDCSSLQTAYDNCLAELNSQRSGSTGGSTLAGVGMTVNTRCLINGQCSMNLYELLGIRRKDTSPTVMSLIQDVILAATTFVGTLMVIALVVSGLLFAIASISGKDTQRAKKIIIDCFVGLLLVMGSYTIVRLIQFLAMAKK